MTIHPLHGRILAKRLADRDKTAGGLLPENEMEAPLEARVISMRTGKSVATRETQALSVTAGDEVPIDEYSSSDITLDGDEHIVQRQNNVLAIRQD